MKDEKKFHGAVNLHQNNIFVNWTRLPLLCEKSGVILLVLVGLTASRQAVKQNIGRYENLKNLYRSHWLQLDFRGISVTKVATVLL